MDVFTVLVVVISVFWDDSVRFCTRYNWFKESVVFISKPKISHSGDSQDISRKERLLKGLIVRVAERRYMKNHRRKEN
jgi:hypothetical protein